MSEGAMEAGARASRPEVYVINEPEPEPQAGPSTLPSPSPHSSLGAPPRPSSSSEHPDPDPEQQQLTRDFAALSVMQSLLRKSMTAQDKGKTKADGDSAHTFNDALRARIAAHTLPPPGPQHFEARRALWTSSTSSPGGAGAGGSHSRPALAQREKDRLDELLSQPGALEDREVWDRGLSSVWKGLVEGGRLKRRLPLRSVVKILQAGWMRDGTWPQNLPPPGDSDGPPYATPISYPSTSYTTPNSPPPPNTIPLMTSAHLAHKVPVSKTDTFPAKKAAPRDTTAAAETAPPPVPSKSRG